jgi:glycosyltransferase involved in cell wall biosynthesis
VTVRRARRPGHYDGRRAMSARICMIALTDYPGDQRVRREAEALVARGDEVDVISPLTPSIGGRRSIDGVGLHPTGRLRRDEKLGFLGYLSRDLAFLVRASVKALRLHRSRRYDVVHVHTMPDYLVFAALGPKLLGAKVVLDLHDLVPELYASKFGVADSAPIVRLTKLVERACVGFADRALAVHEPHLDAIVGHGNPREKFTIVMNAPDPRLFARATDGAARAGFTFVYHGTISQRHGLDVAVRAVALARRSHDDIRLEVVGDGDGVAAVRSLAAELDLGDAVVVTEGRFPAEDLQPLFGRASAGVVPLSHDVFTRYMLPVKLLEYVALGLPVICSRTDTVEAYFNDTMVSFVEPGNVDDLAEKLVALRADEGLRRSLVANANAFLDEHSWERERERYYSVIDSLLGTASADRAPVAVGTDG